MEKKNLRRVRPGWLLLLLFLLVLGVHKVQAQTIVHAGSNTDLTTGIAPGYMNSAVIDYSPNCSGTCSSNGQLKAIVIDNSGTSPLTSTVLLDDGVSGLSFTFSGSYPAVVLGNGTGAVFYPNVSLLGTTEYLMGIVYTLPSYPCLYFTNNVFMDIYDISGVGTGSMSCPTTPVTSINIDVTGWAGERPHISIAPDYYDMHINSQSIGGLPVCDQFVVSWTEPNPTIPLFYHPNFGWCVPYTPPITNNNYGLNLCYGSLNSLFTPVFPSAMSTGNPVNSVDVAFVQRNNGSTFDPIAYLTFTDVGGYWYENECKLSGTPTFTSPITLGPSSMDVYPRIAATANYQYNNTPATYFDWAAVNNDLSGLIYLQPGWASPASPISPITTFTGWWPGITDYYPVISSGAGNYSIGFYHPDSYNSFLTAPALDWRKALYSAYYPPSTYYRVNYNTTTYTQLPTSVSSTCNNDNTFSYSNPPDILGCWNDGTVWFKEAPDVTSWKPGHSTGIAHANANKQWQVSPNPATDHITLTAPANTANASYKLCDITGRELWNAAIGKSSETVDISGLANGIYLLHIYEGDIEVKTTKFVKQ